MKSTTLLVSLSAAALSSFAHAADDPERNRAFQDHVAYVATFAAPVLAEKCEAFEPGYLAKFGAAYFAFANSNQDRIERGRLLTQAELAPNETLQSYREQVLRSRLGAMGAGTPERKRKMCEGALSALGGHTVPGEWPPRP